MARFKVGDRVELDARYAKRRTVGTITGFAKVVKLVPIVRWDGNKRGNQINPDAIRTERTETTP